MASILKNQILKHLSKFTKNLSPDKLQLSALKGSFEVNNIELNETVLMELLEMPVWISLTKAHCNYASIKIQWMKLKTVPIYIMLDEVVIEGETCENFREEVNLRNSNFNYQDTGSYGFTNKVIDGITLSINSVVIQFQSKIFSASFELTRITIESRNCFWKKVDDLSKTRIRDPARGQVLLFKHIEWQTLRFVAKSETISSVGQAPLRLIANQASCRLTLKKRLSDCAILGARIMVIFDDLLWVLTDSQLLSALHFADYLGGLIKRAPHTKTFDSAEAKHSAASAQQAAKQKLPNLANPNMSSPTKKPSQSAFANSISTLFSQHDFLETSHHLIVRRIEVHLMDDLGPQSERSQCPELSEGGALQMTFLRLLIDMYPYQSVNGSRNHWFRYSEPSTNRQSFINHKLKTFYMRQQANLKNEGSNFNLQYIQYHLLSRVVVIRLSDYSIGCVSTNSSKSCNKSSYPHNVNNSVEPLKLIAFDHSQIIPGNVNPIYIELNSYFYLEPLDKLNFPLPDTNVFISVAPVRINFEPITILWINAFFANLRNALIKLQEAFPTANSNQEKVNLRAEIMGPTVTINLNPDDTETEDNMANLVQEYSLLEVKISRILVFNCDSYIQKEYFKSLEDMLKYFSSKMDFYFEKSTYPWLSCDMKSISNEFVRMITQWFTNKSPIEDTTNNMALDFWTVNIEPLWLEFKSSKLNRYESFLEPVNLTLWLYQAAETDQSGIDMNIIAKVNNPVKLQINHHQLLFVLQMMDKIGEFTSMLHYDTYMIQRAHYKRDCERDADVTVNQLALNSFDVDEKVIKAIFKSTAVITSIPEVNVFLLLKEEQRDDDIVCNDSVAPQDVEEISVIQQETHSDGSAIDDPSTNCDNLNGHPSEENLTAISNLSSLNLSTNNLAEFVDSYDDNSSKGANLVRPHSINGLLPISDQHSTKSNEANDKLVDLGSPLVLGKQNSLNRKQNNSFDSSNLKVHYNCNFQDNDDALSSFSDLSADDSDQLSFIAMIQDGNETIDDIFLDQDLEPIEVAELAEEISPNFNVTNFGGGGDDDTLNDSPLYKPVKIVPKTTYLEVLQVKIRDFNLIQQSSKGFLSQVFCDTRNIEVNEHRNITQGSYQQLYKTGRMEQNSDENLNTQNVSNVSDNLRLTLRIDSYNKGTLRDELISVRAQNLCQTLNKDTIDLVVDFFNDPLAVKVVPIGVVLEQVQIEIVDTAVRLPPIVFAIPKLKLVRNKENRWLLELDSSLPKDCPLHNQLLLQHLKIFERNLLFDIRHLITEKDRLSFLDQRLITVGQSAAAAAAECESENQQILQQVLDQKELLLQEIELLRKENELLRAQIEHK